MRAVPVGFSFETKPSLGREVRVEGLAKLGWRTPGVVGKSSASVIPATTILPAPSWASALITFVPDGACEKPYHVPPKNVDHSRPLPPALSCVTKPLLARSMQRQTVCTAPAVMGKSWALVAPPTV